MIQQFPYQIAAINIVRIFPGHNEGKDHRAAVTFLFLHGDFPSVDLIAEKAVGRGNIPKAFQLRFVFIISHALTVSLGHPFIGAAHRFDFR